MVYGALQRKELLSEPMNVSSSKWRRLIEVLAVECDGLCHVQPFIEWAGAMWRDWEGYDQQPPVYILQWPSYHVYNHSTMAILPCIQALFLSGHKILHHILFVEYIQNNISLY